MGIGSITEGTTIDNACMTHYWDCAKPDVAWDKTSTSNTDSEYQNGSMTVIIIDDDGNQVSTVAVIQLQLLVLGMIHHVVLIVHMLNAVIVQDIVLPNRIV